MKTSCFGVGDCQLSDLGLVVYDSDDGEMINKLSCALLGQQLVH